MIRRISIEPLSVVEYLSGLLIKKKNDLIRLQKILQEVDLIENFYVNEFSKKSAFIKIKYYGKINKITEKLSQKGINIIVESEQWKVSLK